MSISFENATKTIEDVFARYTGIFEEVENASAHLAQFPTHCVLFDFDVLQCYLECGPDTADVAYAIDFFLQHGRSSFALPVGAFFELSAYFQRLKPVFRRIEGVRFTDNLGRDVVLQQLGLALGLKCVSSLTPAELETLLITTINSHHEQMVRLLRFLKHPRFSGVKNTFSKEALAIWQKLFNARPPRHYPAANQARAIHNDALNLAVATNSALVQSLRANSQKPVSAYVLVTRTQSILSFPEYVKLDSCLRAIWQLAASKFINSIFRHFPAITPAGLLTFELFGGAVSRQGLGMTRILNARCQETFEWLETQIRQLKRGVGTHLSMPAKPQKYENALQPFRAHARGLLQHHLREAWGTMAKQADSSHFLTWASGHAEYAALSLMHAKEEENLQCENSLFHQIAFDFGKTASEVGQLLASQKAHALATSIGTPSPQQPFIPIAVEHKFDSRAQLILGEVYPATTTKAQYTLRWITQATDYDLMLAMHSVFGSPRKLIREQKPWHPIAVERGNAAAAGPRIEIATDIGNFFYGLHSKNSKWEELLSAPILSKINQLPYGGTGKATIYKLHIVLDNCSIAFDIIAEALKASNLPKIKDKRFVWHGDPGSQPSDRFVTFCSEVQSNALVAQLFQRTSTTYVNPGALELALTKALTPTIPSS